MFVFERGRDRSYSVKKYTISVHFDIGQDVFRKCDPDKYLYIVVSYMVDKKDVLYKISGIAGDFYCYHFEIVDFQERMAVLN